MRELVDYLGLVKYGTAELEFVPSDGGPTRWGHFDDVVALETAVADYGSRGTITLGIQPRTEGATNRFKRLEPPEAAVQIANVAFRVYLPDDGESDSTTAATALADRMGAGCAFVWQVSDGTCYLFAGIPPFEPPEDLPASLRRLASQTQRVATDRWPDVTVEAITDWMARVPVMGRVLRRASRHEAAKLGRMLHRPIPPEVYRELTKRGGQIARLFRGEGVPGHDEHGRELPAVAASFDRAFVDTLINAGFTDDEVLIDALWNRPGCAARAGGLDAVREVVHAAQNRMAAKTAPGSPAPRKEEPTTYEPDTPLRDRVFGDYLEWSDRSGRFVWRLDCDITAKAYKVVGFLTDQGAEFYHFTSSQETVFVVGGTQHIVDTRDTAYQRWFTSNVKLFGPNTPRGRELTDALRVAIQQHDRCHEPKMSRWGHFERDADLHKAVMYLCFDPDHAQILRISPAGADGVPRVDTLPNGADGVTLRGPLGRETRFEYRPGCLERGWKMFRDEIHAWQALTKTDQLMSTAFNLTTLIPDHGQRPIKFHRGAPSSGKTSAAKDWELVLYGRVYASDYNDKPSLLHAIKLGGPFITQDNPEAATRRKFSQLYLVAATGASHKLRKYYHESQPVVFEPNGTLCLTAVEPMTKTEELRRTFEFGFDAEHHTAMRVEDEGTRERRLKEASPLMLSAVLDMFSLYILPAVASGKYVDCVKWLQTQQLGSKKGFLGWLAWMLLMTETVGGHLNPGLSEFRDEFAKYLRDQNASEKAARVEGDTALSCLDQIKVDATVEARRTPNSSRLATSVQLYNNTIRAVRYPDGSVEIGPLTTADLFKAMSSVARTHGLKLAYEHGRALGARLAVLAEDPAFKEMGWSRVQHEGRARGNNYRYTYTWVPEIPLVASDGPEAEPAPPAPPPEDGEWA